MPARHSAASVSPRPSTIYGRHAVLTTSLQSIYSRITAQPERALGRDGQVEQTGNRNMADFQLYSTQHNRELRAQVSDTFKSASSLYTIINEQYPQDIVNIQHIKMQKSVENVPKSPEFHTL